MKFSYILNKYVDLAKEEHPSLIPETVSPHGLRHSKSMHMLQAGVPLIYIRDFLGHSEISTTEIYARCDSEQKRKAIEAACLEDSQEQYQMAFIKCQYTDDYLLTTYRLTDGIY